jgi:hypothetical protein
LAARRSAALAGAFVAAALTLASPAHASCRFPAGSTDTPAGVARVLFSNSDALGFAVVAQPLDIASSRPEEIEMGFALKGPGGSLVLDRPGNGASILVTNAQTSFEAPAGALVFAALNRTRTGWVIGECTAQLLNAFPLALLMPELQREYSATGRRSRLLEPAL